MGLRKSNSSIGAALAFWLGNTALNPAVLIFMTFVLSWKYTVLRVVFGAILVFGISHLANRFAKPEEVEVTVDSINSSQLPKVKQDGPFLLAWVKNLWSFAVALLPVYFLSVLLLGALRAWLFPAISPDASHGILAIIGFAIAGTLFVIPTAGEIPIIQTLRNFGIGTGPAAALLITLPVISIPSILMVKRVFSWRVIGFVTASVVVLGVAAGIIGSFTL